MKRRCATWLALLLLPWPAWAAFIDLDDRIERIPPYTAELPVFWPSQSCVSLGSLLF